LLAFQFECHLKNARLNNEEPFSTQLYAHSTVHI
jgi:hypothetical protein